MLMIPLLIYRGYCLHKNKNYKILKWRLLKESNRNVIKSLLQWDRSYQYYLRIVWTNQYLFHKFKGLNDVVLLQYVGLYIEIKQIKESHNSFFSSSSIINYCYSIIFASLISCLILSCMYLSNYFTHLSSFSNKQLINNFSYLPTSVESTKSPA